MKKIVIIMVSLLIISGCSKATPILKDDIKIEVNKEVKINELISEENKVIIINKNDLVDTSKIGENEIIIKYDDKGEKTAKYIINVIDTVAPTIEGVKNLSTYTGSELDLLKNIKVNDNSNETINATIEGEYNLSKVGKYNLKYVAVDSSNNKTEKKFILEVKKKEDYGKYGNNKIYYGKYKLEVDGNYKGTITLNQDGTASSTGHIYLKGKFVKKDLTGKWKFKAKSIGGLAFGPGGPEDIIKVDGIFFEWSDGNKSSFGLSSKYFGDQFQGYKWYSK